MEDADLDLVIEGALWGGFGTSGQRCTASSRLIVQQSVVGKVTEALVERVRALKVGDGLDASTDVGPLIDSHQQWSHSRTQLLTLEWVRRKVLTPDRRAVVESDELDNGHFYSPTLFAGVGRQCRIAHKEIFGPTVAVMGVKDFDQAIETANGTQYGLSLSIYTKDIDRAFRAIRDLQSGLVSIPGPNHGCGKFNCRSAASRVPETAIAKPVGASQAFQ